MIELDINKKDINRIKNLLEDLSPSQQGKAIEKGIKKASTTVLRQLVSNVSGVILKRRTGNLARSMGWRLDKDKNGVPEATVGSGASLKTARMSYANIHETGGTIRPINAKMLTIPLKAAKTAAGVPRFTAREVQSGAAGYDSSFIGRSKSGNLILFGSIKGMAKIKVVPLFLLKDKVDIPARRYMSVTVEQTRKQVVDDIVDKIKEAKEKAQ